MKNGKNINLYSDPSLRNESHNLLEEGYQTLVTPRTQDKSKGKEKDNFQTVGKGLKKKKKGTGFKILFQYSVLLEISYRG